MLNVPSVSYVCPHPQQGRPVVFYFARESTRAMDCGLNKNQSRELLLVLLGFYPI